MMIEINLLPHREAKRAADLRESVALLILGLLVISAGVLFLNGKVADELISAPWTLASQIRAAARTAVRCCRIKPGFFRRARIPVIENGLPSTIDNANDERRICPPPSPSDPSISSISFSTVTCRMR